MEHLWAASLVPAAELSRLLRCVPIGADVLRNVSPAGFCMFNGNEYGVAAQMI
jgi:hypothetical protein